MQQRQSTLERRFRLRLARGREVDLAELLWREVRVIVLVLGERPPGHDREGCCQDQSATEGQHGFLLGWGRSRFCHIRTHRAGDEDDTS